MKPRPTDPAAIAARKRKLRRRHKRERQALILGALLAGLAVAGLGAAAIWTGAMDAPFDRGFTTVSPSPTATTSSTPCVPPDTLPVAYSEITLRVYNGTTRAGLAGTTADLLGQRGFEIALTENYPVRVHDAARISFGAAGIAQAHTVAAHFFEVTFVYDARGDDVVDIALGREFGQLVPIEQVDLDPEVALRPVPGCAPLGEVTPAPAPSVPGDEADDEGAADESDEGDADSDDNADEE